MSMGIPPVQREHQFIGRQLLHIQLVVGWKLVLFPEVLRQTAFRADDPEWTCFREWRPSFDSQGVDERLGEGHLNHAFRSIVMLNQKTTVVWRVLHRSVDFRQTNNAESVFGEVLDR